MSAFLGPIHFWLYNKIGKQEELTKAIASMAAGNGWISDRTAYIRDLPALEDVIDESNIHGWLQDQIHDAKTRYADLIQTAEMQGNRKEFERSLSMLAQKVRSLGIHLIIATQRPSANIVTGVLKANIPYRISFRLPSHTDSQTILDMSGAENLLGMGDMLMVTESDVKRMQGLFITEEELTEFAEGYMNR